MGGQRRTPPSTDGIFASEKNETMPFAAPCSLQHYVQSKIWKQSKCPSVDEWIKKLLYIYIFVHFLLMDIKLL